MDMHSLFLEKDERGREYRIGSLKIERGSSNERATKEGGGQEMRSRNGSSERVKGGAEGVFLPFKGEKEEETYLCLYRMGRGRDRSK